MTKNTLVQIFLKFIRQFGKFYSPHKNDDISKYNEKESWDSNAQVRGRRCRSGGWGWACGGKQARPEAAWPGGGGERSRAASSSSYGGDRPSDGFASPASSSAVG